MPELAAAAAVAVEPGEDVPGTFVTFAEDGPAPAAEEEDEGEEESVSMPRDANRPSEDDGGDARPEKSPPRRLPKGEVHWRKASSSPSSKREYAISISELRRAGTKRSP